MDKTYLAIKPYFQDTFSLLMSFYCCFCLYKFKQTNNTQWFKNICYLFLPYLIIDFYLETRLEFWIHHACTIFLTSFTLYKQIIPDILTGCIFTSLLTETSSIFLSIKMLIRTYLKNNTTNKKSELAKLLKKINPINDIIFYILFIYTRIYLFGKNVLYNMDLYIKNVSGSVLTDKIGLMSLWTIGLLNYYWFILITKKAINVAFGYDVFKYRPDINDPFLKQIAEINQLLYPV